jgi:serine phosphatase RsbU (regulator of sigma subunit)
VIPLCNGFIAIVADVCGKGIPAALLASMAQGMFHGQVNLQTGRSASLTEAVQSVNAFICSRTPKEKYLTLAALRYTQSDSGEPHIELVNGGHVAPLIVRADGRVEAVEDSDLPVGLFDFAQFHAIPLSIAVGDRIVLLSDGISEAEDPGGTQFGFDQLQGHLSDADPVNALFSAMEQFCQGADAQDDQTVLAIERIA